MANSSNILDKLKKMREGLSAVPLKPDVLAALTQKLDLIHQIVVNLQLKDQLRDLQAPVAASVPATAAKPEEVSLKEKIERLKDVGTSRTENEKLCFVLHRPTVDFEYENGIDGQDFTTKEDTEWIADFEESTALRSGTNPVIAVWVGEDDIKDVPNAFSSVNDQFGSLGTNTSKNKYRVIVRPGKYPIYQELKKANKNSLFVLAKSLKERLKKSEQYTKLDPKLLELKNSDKALSSNNINSEKAEEQIKEGKLDPRDVDTIIKNRNQDLNNLLLQREDLTTDQLTKMISHKEDFLPGHRRARTSEGGGMHKIMLMGLKERNPNYTDEMVKNGNDSAIYRLFQHSPNHASGNDIMHLITKRHDLSGGVMDKVFEHPSFDSGHGIELLKHPNAEVINSGLSKLNRKEKLDSNVLAAGLGHKNPEVVKHLIEHGEFPLNDQQVMGLMNHPNDEIKAMAAGRAKTPEQVNHAIDMLQTNPEHKKMALNLVGKEHLGYGDRNHKHDAAQSDRLVDYAMAKHPQILETDDFWNHDISPESMKKIAASSLSPEAKNQIFDHANLNPDVIQTLLNADKNPELMKRVARSGTATPEQITQAWNQMDKKKRISRGYGDNARKEGDFSEWINNPNTPPEIINHLMENKDKYALGHGNLAELSIDKRLDPKHISKLLSSEDPDVRKLAAHNPATTSEQIMHGLQDKDKAVRSKFLARSDLQPAHLAMALKDRAPSNRAEVVKHGNMTPELLHQVVTKDKSEDVRKNAIQHENTSHDTLKHAVMNDISEGVRTAALKHKNASKELIDQAINNPTADHATQLVDRPDLSTEQITKLSQALKQRHNDIEKERKAKSYRADWDLAAEQGKLTDAMYKYMTKPNIDQNFKDHFLTTADPDILDHVIQADSTVSPAVLEHAYNLDKELQGKSGKGGKYYRGELGDSVLRNANAPKTGIFNKIINEGSNEDHEKLVKLANNKLTPDQQKTLIEKTNSESILHHVASNAKFTPELENIIYNKNKQSTMPDGSRPGSGFGYDDDLIHRAMARNSSISPETMEKFSAHANPAVRRELLNNTSIPEHIVDRHLKDADESVKAVAGETVAHTRPDAFNASIDDAHDIHLHPATEKLKHLKGLVQEKGGTVAKKDLPQQYQNLGQLFDGKGNMTEQTIDKYLHDLPKHKFNVSYGKWDSSLQTHDDGESGPQKVLQVNLTNDHVKQLKEQGLYDTFRKLHEMSYRSGHPVRKHSLGWARIDDSHPDHWHIDEIQSDLGQGTIRQIEKAKQSGDMNEEEADKYTNDLKGIMKTLSGPFKNINHAISGAVHETGRTKGIKSTSMDKLEDQAKQSGMDTDKNLPGHMINTYKQVPEDIGYAEKPKKEAMPNTTAPEPSVNFRKLVKSYGAFKFLAKYVEDSE